MASITLRVAPSNEDLEFSCNCREKAALRKLCSIFSDAMYEKLIEKLEEGYTGWCADDEGMILALIDGLYGHISKDLNEENLIDIANYLAMIWNYEMTPSKFSEIMRAHHYNINNPQLDPKHGEYVSSKTIFPVVHDLAVAPDLLNTLKAIDTVKLRTLALWLDEKDIESGTTGHEVQDDIRNWCSMIESAIAMAEGDHE